MTDDDQIRALYQRIVNGWNGASAARFAAPFAPDGVVIGFDGSKYSSRPEIESELGAIFADHQTGKYVGKVRSVRRITSDAAVLLADVGMTPPGGSDLAPQLTARQSLVAERRGGVWTVALFQTTPAQLHGRPEQLEALVDELREELPRGGGGGAPA